MTPFEWLHVFKPKRRMTALDRGRAVRSYTKSLRKARNRNRCFFVSGKGFRGRVDIWD